MPMYGGSQTNQQSGLDWSQMFQAGAHQTYVNTSFNPNLGQTQIGTKTEPNSRHGTTAASASDPHPNWGIPSYLQNPYNQISDQILNFFYPPNQAIDPLSAGMNLYFSPDNIKDFLDKYTHFSIHVPILHVATFKITEAYTGLLAGMCCIGACYSDHVTPANVREMMDFLLVALERESRVMSGAELQDPRSRSPSQADIEELQAILLLYILLVWNGTPHQRDKARRFHPLLVSTARKFKLLSLSDDLSLSSPIHQADASFSHSFQDFNWESWIDQERRNRLLFGIFLCDVAMGLYFNVPPLMDAFEINLPLPADDAAWDADTADVCASALGLSGVDAAQEKNAYGTRLAKQPEVNSALKALLHSSYNIQPGVTNLYGKFILIHAILALVRRSLVEGNMFSNYETPPPCDWIVPAETSSSSTDLEGHNFQSLDGALNKFKASWDTDMSSQFPPTTPASNNPRRHGFSRDGIHFYWLAKYMLQHTRPEEFQMAPDARFMQVMQLLKSVRAWVMSDGASRGEELGSIGGIDDQYGAMDLTLDMAKLFMPLPNVVGDAGTASVKTEIKT
ncbi:fungal-specific transcription factor domain-containing protein [Mariannaea sp. PMI_226]|nr:fungal-specific transcription factor domain-containing protein [Mariannaea sp. PMI_226]